MNERDKKVRDTEQLLEAMRISTVNLANALKSDVRKIKSKRNVDDKVVAIREFMDKRDGYKDFLGPFMSIMQVMTRLVSNDIILSFKEEGKKGEKLALEKFVENNFKSIAEIMRR